MTILFKTPVHTAATTLVGLGTVAAIAYGAACGAYTDCREMPSKLSTFMAIHFLTTDQAMKAAMTYTPDEIYAITAASLSVGSAMVTGAAHTIFRGLYACCAKKEAATNTTIQSLEEGRSEQQRLLPQ